MESRFWKLFDWGSRATDAATLIAWLITLATTSGVLTTITLFWQQLPWYQALVNGASLAAALVILIVGVDHLLRIHTISKKIAVFELRVAHIEIIPATKKLTIVLIAFVGNRALRPIWFKVRAGALSCRYDDAQSSTRHEGDGATARKPWWNPYPCHRWAGRYKT
jgi:hypothetical protein